MAFGRRDGLVREWLERLIPVQTLTEAQNLALRFKEGKAFRLYLRKRLALVIPISLVVILISVSCAAAFVVYIAGLSAWLALPAIILMPVVLIGSLFVQAFVLFSWLETRGIARTLGQRAKPPKNPVAVWLLKHLRADMGTAPSIPWVLAAIFLGGPLALMATFAPAVALGLIVLLILAPIVYAVFDR